MLGNNNKNKLEKLNQNQNIESNSNFVQFVVFGKYDFTAEEYDEITFKRGDPILVLEKDDEHKDGWWKGKTVDKMIGLFPVEFTTFINVKQINIDGLFDELNNPENGKRETNISSNNNLQNMNNSPQTSVSEFHTPVMNYIDRDQNKTPNSPAFSNSRRVSFSSASGTGSTSSPQVLQYSVQKPPKLSLGNPATLSQKDFHNVHPTYWTVDQVVEFLEEIGFGSYSQMFRENNINGSKLLDQTLSTFRELGISNLKERLKLYNSIVSIKEHAEKENEINASMIQNNSSMVNDNSQLWQHKVYNDKYVIDEESDSMIGDGMSVSSNGSSVNKSRRGNEFIDARNNARQIYGPTVVRPHLNNMVSRESIQLTNTNFNYYQSVYRDNKPPSQSSKSSISSISSFFRRLSISRPSKKNNFVFEPMFQQADYQGWLWTRFNKNSKWKKRWIILSREKVYFLKEPKHPVNIKHTIQLNITFSIQPDIHKGKTKYTFNLIDSANQQVTYFSADNHLIMMTWINVLVRATTASAHRIQPLPEGKAPISRSPNIPQSPASIVGIQPIYGVNSQVVQTPNSYAYQPNQPSVQPSPSVIRNQNMQVPNYVQQPSRPSVISSRNNLSHTASPRVIGTKHSQTPLQTSVQIHTPIHAAAAQHQNKRMSISSTSPLMLPQAHRQPSNPQMITQSPLTLSDAASIPSNPMI
ncbi:hypothetical protein BCR36DRAFT_408951 [Piromyces finnis]|uniref:PH-domain-containing protein n=1 Tax=Piromyces finnis TaxID=1754191 RepID=A0A1Y1VK34_9FUNG|nr:hypothetical protein BCR36DRAFT_408951 [Piromyces finnis]|eukprot:ORX58441.1 hypothetical protein BCR36DRAFT_408951 [Piromyces finnis]